MLPKPSRIRKVRVSYSVLIPLFVNGLSTRQIAKQGGLSSSRVQKMLYDIGLGRPKSEAAMLRQPATSKHWRSSRQAARRLWERANGPIPEGHHIHHIDGDFTNNIIENLACIEAGQHTRLHWTQGDIPTKYGYGDPTPRHLRAHRKEYMAAYSERTVEERVCGECGISFVTSIYSPATTTCSHSCGAKKSWRKRHASTKA